jgi:mitogen-activated protein kinase 1/3
VRRQKKYLKTLPLKLKKNFKDIFPHASPSAIDLLTKMLCFDPVKRITVEEALAHPYLESMHDPEDEPVHKSKFDFFFDKSITKDNKEAVKKMIFDEIAEWNREMNKIDVTLDANVDEDVKVISK